METKLRVNTKAKPQKSSEFDEELEPVSPTSEYFLNLNVTAYILSFFELKCSVHFPSIYAFLDGVFVNVHPRFSSIVINIYMGSLKTQRARETWKIVEVNTKDHVKVPVFSEGLEDYSTQFDDYISEIATSQIPSDKPLWQFHIFNYPTKNATGTIIFKCHHAIADGTTLMGVVLSCIQRSDDPSKPLSFPSRNTTMDNKYTHKSIMKVFNSVPKFMASTFYAFCDFGQSLRLLFSGDDRTPIRSGKTESNQHYKICKVELSLTDVKRIKTVLGVTVNDVVSGVIFFGMRLYMQELNHGRLKNTRSTVVITLNIRRDRDYASPEEMRQGNSKVPWGNRFALIDLGLTNAKDEDIKNPFNFILKAHKLIKRKRNTPLSQFLLFAFLGVVRTCGGLQAATETFEKRTKHCTFLMTSMIGPNEKMSLASHPVKGFYFMPTGLISSLTVSVMSYMETLTIGLAVEKGFIDHQRLITCMEKAFRLINQAATTTSNSS